MIQEENDIRKSCLYCKYFSSFAEDYYDELEPYDYGSCIHEKNKGEDEVFGEGVSCEFFENKNIKTE